MQRTNELFFDKSQCRLMLATANSVKHLKRHAVLFKNFNVFANAVKLLLGTKQLQGTLRNRVINKPNKNNEVSRCF